uniref:C3H1-type domain-containing protein n=1 Tax=Panagrellus redivivus TaxID=6233 RepID=A0A7E4VC95_PANRE
MAGGSDGYISDGSGDYAVTEALAKEESDAISMNEESPSIDDVTPAATPVQKPSTDEPQAEPVSDVEDADAPVLKKVKTEIAEPREDLEDGEIETDSDEEVPEPQQCPPPRSLRSLSPIACPIPLNRLPIARPPRVDFPRNSNGSTGSNGSRRRRPEDYGICKFYLRDNCTWGDRCKYGHPVGKERVDWLKDLGLPDLSTSNTSNASSSRPSRRRSNSPRGDRSSRDRKNSHVNGKRPERLPSPISSEGSRSPSPSRPVKRQRTPPKTVAVSSDEEDERPQKSESPRRRRRRSDRDRSRSSSRDSNSRSPPPKRSSIRELLRKHRFEAEQRTSSPAVESVTSDEDDSNLSKPLPKKPSPREAAASPELQAVSSDEENDAVGDGPMFRDRSASPPVASV